MSLRRRCWTATLLASVLLGACSGGGPRQAVEAAFDEHPERAETMCDEIRTMTGSSELSDELDAYTLDERAEMVDGIRSAAGDGIFPDDAAQWGWDEVRELWLEIYNVCEERMGLS